MYIRLYSSVAVLWDEWMTEWMTVWTTTDIVISKLPVNPELYSDRSLWLLIISTGARWHGYAQCFINEQFRFVLRMDVDNRCTHVGPPIKGRDLRVLVSIFATPKYVWRPIYVPQLEYSKWDVLVFVFWILLNRFPCSSHRICMAAMWVFLPCDSCSQCKARSNSIDKTNINAIWRCIATVSCPTARLGYNVTKIFVAEHAA